MTNLKDKLKITKPASNQQPATSSPKLWGPVAASLWAVVIYLVPQVVVGLLLSIYPAIKHWNSVQANAWLTNSAAAQFVYTLLVEAMAIWFVLLLLRYYKTARGAIGLVRARLQDIWYAAAGFGVYFVAFIVLVGAAHVLIPGLNVNQQQNVGFQQATTGISIAMAFVSLVLLPPIAEEIIFRGFVYTGFRRKFGFVVATLGTSILFAAPHLLEATSGGPLWVAGIDTFILSFVLCFLREKTGRLWAGMGVHALKNGVAFASIFIFHVH